MSVEIKKERLDFKSFAPIFFIVLKVIFVIKLVVSVTPLFSSIRFYE